MVFLLGVSNSNLTVECFVVSSFKNFIRSFLLAVCIKNISSMNLEKISENPLRGK